MNCLFCKKQIESTRKKRFCNTQCRSFYRYRTRKNNEKLLEEKNRIERIRNCVIPEEEIVKRETKLVLREYTTPLQIKKKLKKIEAKSYKDIMEDKYGKGSLAKYLKNSWI